MTYGLNSRTKIFPSTTASMTFPDVRFELPHEDRPFNYRSHDVSWRTAWTPARRSSLQLPPAWRFKTYGLNSRTKIFPSTTASVTFHDVTAWTPAQRSSLQLPLARRFMTYNLGYHKYIFPSKFMSMTFFLAEPEPTGVHLPFKDHDTDFSCRARWTRPQALLAFLQEQGYWHFISQIQCELAHARINSSLPRACHFPSVVQLELSHVHSLPSVSVTSDVTQLACTSPCGWLWDWPSSPEVIR